MRSMVKGSHQLVTPLIVTHWPRTAHLKLCDVPTLKVVTTSESVVGFSRQFTVELPPTMLQSMLPGRVQGVRKLNNNTTQEENCPLLRFLMALTTEELVRVGALLGEASDLYPGFRGSLPIDELNGRGQDGQGHASNDELDELHPDIFFWEGKSFVSEECLD